ncbi:MAG: hypothetical protein Ta2F_03620 [Termitinemataceae bacterium]|nr:MAG: hypothetical protein Ta2F_03620 [Termitinemataceae bacterium]
MKNKIFALLCFCCTFFAYAQETENTPADIDMQEGSAQISKPRVFKANFKTGIIIDFKKYSDRRTLNDENIGEYFNDSPHHISLLIEPHFEYKNFFIEDKTSLGSEYFTKAVLGYIVHLRYFDFSLGAGIFYDPSTSTTSTSTAQTSDEENNLDDTRSYHQTIKAPSVNINFQKDWKNGATAILKAAYYPYMFIDIMHTLPAEKYYIKANAMGFNVEAGGIYHFKNTSTGIYAGIDYTYYYAKNAEIAANNLDNFLWMEGAQAELKSHNISINLGVSYEF